MIPIHEFGHVIFHWLSGNPAWMSYARDNLFPDSEKTFLGYLGGPIFPLLLGSLCLIPIYKGIKLEIFYAMAILGPFERMILYITGVIPSDERALAKILNWPEYSWLIIFLVIEITLLFLFFYSLKVNKLTLKNKILVIIIPLVSFILMAILGVFIIERFIFPEQFKLQFG